MRKNDQGGVYTAARLSRELRDQAETTATQNGWTLAHLLRVAVRDYVSGRPSAADASPTRGRPWRSER